MATKKSKATETTTDLATLENVLGMLQIEDENIENEIEDAQQIEDENIEDVEFIEMQRVHKSEIVSEIKKRASNLDRFKNGRSSKFNGDKYIYRKLLQMVDSSQLEELNNMLKAKLEKLI